ncbi:hypothetical protein [Clostridium sp. 'White wine YQ']|uniref:hypothetical protein n=1 Tax=Clostridium sp. 'White wine YQ' TaxID=3027474 RepID=UPI002365F681|nr:hypothetical protein [Clostridium sp. 'White wine YQ']MDD7796037.1 hypothetical protein [Clostridium sp. 'White wine YQ']
MNKRFVLLLLVLIFSISLFDACSSQKPDATNISTNSSKNETDENTHTLAMPEKIIYYGKGNTTTFTKDDKKFNALVNEINSRVKNIKGQYKSIFMLDDIKGKGMLLELDYPKKHTFEYTKDNGEKETFTYTKLYFDLDKNDEISNEMAFEGEGYGPVGKLLPTDKLLDILNAIWD